MPESSATQFLEGGGAMAEAIRRFDWSATSLGPIGAWPAALRIATGMMVNSRFPKCLVWGPDLVTLYNDAFKPILGAKPEALGRSFLDVWSEASEVIAPMVDKALAGEPTFIEDFPLVVERNGYPEQTYFTFCYSPVRDEDGTIAGMMNTVIETTGKVESEKTARLLNAELAHRIKNTLAMVSAVANQTFRSTATKDEAQAVLSQRIAALGHAHTILTQASWRGAPVRAVVEGALAPHRTGSGRFLIEGPPINLPAKHSLSLALATNELATNAIKYGALSTDSGEVSVVWQAGTPGSDEPFRLIWSERGGPRVAPPQRRGFGSRMIEHALAADFGGEVRIDFLPEGLRCELVTTMHHLHIEPDEEPGAMA